MVDYPSSQPAGKKVAVVVPVKNDAKRLSVMLASLSKQTVEHEVIVVDNGSSDESPSVGIPYGAKVLDGPGLRVGAMRNLGVAQTQAELLAFCDSDHEVPEDWLESAIVSLAKHPGKTMVGAPCLPPIKSTWVQSVWAIHRLRAMNHGAFETEWLGAGNMILYRRDFLEIGGFSENLVASEDVDLCHRLRAVGGRVICDPSIRNYHHGEPKSIRNFLQKEYWRGSSGIKSWVKLGFPLSEVPSLVWPLWHLLVPIVGLLLVFVALFKNLYLAAGLGLLSTAVVWFAPALALAVKNAKSLGPKTMLQLATLYFVYGLARAGALFKGW